MLFPIAFAWRHYTELALKDIIAAGRQLAGLEWGYPSGHKLLQLWKEARPHLEQLGDPNAPELANVESNVCEFERIDQFADGFRYPLNRARTEPRLHSPPPTVSLRRLHEAMDAVATFLLCARSEQSVSATQAPSSEVAPT